MKIGEDIGMKLTKYHYIIREILEVLITIIFLFVVTLAYLHTSAGLPGKLILNYTYRAFTILYQQ